MRSILLTLSVQYSIIVDHKQRIVVQQSCRTFLSYITEALYPFNSSSHSFGGHFLFLFFIPNTIHLCLFCSFFPPPLITLLVICHLGKSLLFSSKNQILPLLSHFILFPIWSIFALFFFPSFCVVNFVLFLTFLLAEMTV